MKRILLTILAAATIGTALGAVLPAQRAKAFLGFGDIVFDPANLAEMLIEEGSELLRDVVVKRIVDDLTDQIINSIENGGTPLFVRDPLKELQRVGDISFDSFNNYLGSETGVNLCAPFSAQLQLYFQTSYQKEPRFGIPLQCTFDEFKQSLTDSAHMIEKNGWISFKQALDPSNNFFGASLLVDQAYMKDTAERIRAKSDALNRNAGFTDVRFCTRWADPVSGALISQSDAEYFARVLAFNDHNHFPASVDEKENFQRAMDSMCETWETQTPGSVVAQAATKGVLKDFEYAANVQSIISALVNSVLSKVFTPSGNGTGGLLAGKSSVRGATLDYGSYNGKTFADQVQKSLNDLRKLERSYYDLRNYLQEKERLVDFGIRLAYQDVYNCAPEQDRYGFARSGGSVIGAPHYGYVVYQPQQGFEITANLDDLVAYPLPENLTDYIQWGVSGNESAANSAVRALASEFRIPVLVHRNQNIWGLMPNKTSFSPEPAADYPQHEGYFNELDRMIGDALGEVGSATSTTGLWGEMREAIAEIGSLATTTVDMRSEIISQLIAGGETAASAAELYEQASSSLLTEYTASSTAFMSALVNTQMRQYHEFSNTYSRVVSEITNASFLNTGPGSVGARGGLSAMLNSLVAALMTPDYTGMNTTSPPNYHYCGEERNTRLH
jgi:hypothetical protein